jgi:hypothetical protein
MRHRPLSPDRHQTRLQPQPSPRRTRLAALAGIAALALAMLGPAVASAATPTGDDVGCSGHWPASTHGKPTMLVSGGRAGDYLWHDARGWHLRVTKVTARTAVFSGRIHADQPISAAGVALEIGDRIALSPDRLTLTYRFVNHGHIDGVDFRTACADHLRIAGSMDGTLLPTGRIWIGATGRHPLQNPFGISRVH